MADDNEKQTEPERRYKRFKPGKDYEEPTEKDIEPVIDLALVSLKPGKRQTLYPANEQGLEAFQAKVFDYFEYIKTENRDPDRKLKLIPDIESMCVFCGITRRSLQFYEARDDTWKDTIDRTREAICACKKTLFLNGKIPPVSGIFDLVNNHSYQNVSEFHIVPEVKDNLTQGKTLEQITAEHQQQITDSAAPAAESSAPPELPDV